MTQSTPARTRGDAIAIAVRCGAGLLLLLCLFLSLKPGGLDHRSVAPGYVEHFLFYVALGAAVALAFRGVSGVRHALLLMALAGVLEAAQSLVPGRQPHVAEFAGSTLGAWFGIFLGTRVALRRVLERVSMWLMGRVA